jgi:hypothetical protein
MGIMAQWLQRGGNGGPDVRPRLSPQSRRFEVTRGAGLSYLEFWKSGKAASISAYLESPTVGIEITLRISAAQVNQNIP